MTTITAATARAVSKSSCGSWGITWVGKLCRRALRRHERKALQTKCFVPRTTDSTHGKRCAPNLLLDQPRPTQANQVWVSDSMYLPLANGNWVYCRAFQDVCTKQGVGWQVRADMPEALVTTALQRALLAQRTAPGLIVHSDRGGQYVGNIYKTLLRDAKAQLSHSRAGECYDNAQAESLWSRLKTELLELRDWPVFADLADAQASVAEYFDYLTLRQPAPGLVIHADRGSQYTSHACRQRIEAAGALASYARPGNPYDNAQAEAGWSTLKTELLPHGGAFTTLEEARLEVAYYLDTYFNLDRRHSALGYRSPHQFEADLLQHLP